MDKKGGFFYGWVIVAAGAAILVMIFGAQYCFGIFFKPLSNEFGWTRAETSGAYSLFFLAHAFAQPVSGMVCDRYGPRLPIIICGLGTGIGYLLMSQMSNLWQFYIYYGLVIGTCATFAFVPLTSTAARWFIKRRALAIGIISAGVGLAAVIMAPAAQFIISTLQWRVSYQILAFIIFVGVLPLSILLVPDPARKGLCPYGAVAAEDSAVVESSHTTDFRLAQAARTKSFWMLGVGFFMFVFCLQMVMVHIVNYATDRGIVSMAAAVILSLIGGFSVLGRIGSGFVSDRLGVRGTLRLALVLEVVSMFWLLWAGEIWAFYVFAAVFGLGYGGGITLVATITGEYFGLKSYGIIFGTILFISCVGGAIGPVVGGHLFDVTGSYGFAFLCGALAMLLAFVMVLFIRKPLVSAVDG